MAKAKKSTKKAAKKGKKKPKIGELIEDMVDALCETSGEGTAMVLGSDAAAIKIRGVISTQSPALDKAIGRGGVPLGRLTIIYGKEGSGKTTLCLHLVAECQRVGGIVVYIDKEYKLDPEYAQAIGVDTKRLIISQPPYLEKVFEIIETAIMMARKYREQTGVRVPILIVLDSMNAAISKATYEGDWEDKQAYGPEALVFSRSLPKIMPMVSKEDVALVWISQVRKKMNVMMGDTDKTAGGNTPGFYASLIMKVTNIGGIKEGEDRMANKTRVECKKNQIAPPFKQAEFEIRYGVGIDQTANLLEQALDAGAITRPPSKKDPKKLGNSYFFNDERFAVGRKQALEQLNEDEEFKLEVLEAIALASGDGEVIDTEATEVDSESDAA